MGGERNNIVVSSPSFSFMRNIEKREKLFIYLFFQGFQMFPSLTSDPEPLKSFPKRLSRTAARAGKFSKEERVRDNRERNIC